MNTRRIRALCLIGLILLFTLHVSCCKEPCCLSCAVFEGLLLAACLFAVALRPIEPRLRRAGFLREKATYFISDTPVRRRTLLLD